MVTHVCDARIERAWCGQRIPMRQGPAGWMLKPLEWPTPFLIWHGQVLHFAAVACLRSWLEEVPDAPG